MDEMNLAADIAPEMNLSAQEYAEIGMQGVSLKGDKGDKGDAGYSPVKGVDYWTETDKEEIVSEVEADVAKELGGKVDKESGKGLSDAASVSVYHATGGNEVLQIVGQDGVTKLTPFYGKQAVDDQMSAFSLGLSEKVDKDTTGMRGLSNAKTVTLSDSISTPSQLKVTEQGGSEFVANFYNAERTDKMLAKLKEQSVPHATVSDYPVTLTDALAGESLRECRIYGSAAGVGDADGDVYKIPVRLRGKNLFDKDNATYLIGYFTKNVTDITTHANARTIYIPCKPNTTYTISRNTSYSNFHFGYTTTLPATGVAVSGAISAASTSITSLTLTTGANAKYLVSYIYNGYSEEGTENAWNTIIGGIQIEEGTSATDYEPYITPQTQTVTLTSPLSVGEYIDLLGKKRYAANGTATDITVTGELKTIESGRLTIDCTTGVQPPRIEAEYWQDINKVVGNLTSAILANGGNA